MNKLFTPTLLKQNVLLAITLLASSVVAQAACVDNGDTTFTCTGTSENADTTLDGTIILDNAAGPVSITNISSNPLTPATLTNTSVDVSSASTLTPNGSNAIVITNIGSNIQFNGDARSFDPAAWANDAFGLLYNTGMLAGYGAAISAGPGVSSLTLNNHPLNNGVFYIDTYSVGIMSNIGASGAYTAAVYTNNPLLTINNTGNISADVISFAGATYTAPALQDGTQYAGDVIAGTTVINNSYADGISDYISGIYVVDRNPLLDAAKAQNPGLALAYSTTDVGPRNSVINNTGSGYIGDIHLGSGAHVINNTNSYLYGTIYVDQNDSEVVDVAGGVATSLYKVHGDRTFTLNNLQITGGQLNAVVIDSVAGAVNTINYTGVSSFSSNLTATGLGDNTVNYTCSASSILQPCNLWGNISGAFTLNLGGAYIAIDGTYNVDGDINVTANNVSIAPSRTIIANNVNVAPSGSLGIAEGVLQSNAQLGNIDGNLVNRGTVNLADATLDVSGDANMLAGSNLRLTVGPVKAGLLNTAGTTIFASGSKLTPVAGYKVTVQNGDSHLIATNIIGTPEIINGTGFLQWSISEETGDLILTASVGVTDYLKPKISQAASNAVDAVFSYTGPGLLPRRLQSELQNLEGENTIRAAERLRPEINDGSIRLVLGATDKVFSIVDSRLLDHYLSSNRNGMEDESLASGGGIWVQGFGDRGQQDAMQGADGYEASVAGMAGGIDRAIDSAGNRRAGFAIGYAQSNASNTGNTINNRVDINSYIASAYASQAFDDWYINGSIGVGRHVYESRRQLLQHSSTGTHDSWQFAAKMTAGLPILLNDSFAFIPTLSLDYSHIEESGYKEKGRTSIVENPYVNGVPTYSLLDSPINLQIQGRSFDSVRGGLGGKAIYSLQWQDWAAELEMRALYRHEFGDIAQDSKARFVMGGNSFASPGVDLARDGILLGGSVRLTGDDEEDQLTLLTSYDADIREKYFGQIVSLNLRYDFNQGPRYTKRARAHLAAMRDGMKAGTSATATAQDIASLQLAMQAVTAQENDTDPVLDPQKQQAVNTTIQNWAKAMSSKNTEAYFGSYAANFNVPEGITRQQWERKRKDEITRQGNSEIKTSYLTIKPLGDQALALFTQTVASGDREETVQKIIDLENENGRWLIVREDTLPLLD